MTHGNLAVAHEQFFIDAFNVFLVTLTAFVGLTTSLFSRPYMRIEAEHGRVSAGQLRLYHSMYQMFIATMLIALTTNNMGLMWVAMEAAHLIHRVAGDAVSNPGESRGGLEVLHSLRRGHLPGIVRHDLMYFAAEKILGSEGVSALLWTHLNAVKGQLEPSVLGLAFVFLLVGYGTRWASRRFTIGCRMHTRRVRHPFPRCLSGLLLNVAMYAVVRCKVLVEGRCSRPCRAAC